MEGCMEAYICIFLKKYKCIKTRYIENANLISKNIRIAAR